jgi:hypothetical protein
MYRILLTLLVVFLMAASCEDELETQTLFVNSARVACEGVSEMECLEVKEHAEDEWTLFYDNIDGFDYEAGYVYELTVEVSEIADPPEDGSSLEYRLIEIVSKTEQTRPGTQTLFVNSARVACEGVSEMECLEVKEQAEDEWTLFYDNIDGFDYEAGYVYELTVEVSEIADPPEDGSSLEYRLIEIVSKTR